MCGHYALKSVLLPSLDLWEALLPSGFVSVFHEDSQAMIQVIKTGRNPTARRLHRVHRISVAWLRERLGPVPGRENTTLEYTASGKMCADVYTKRFADPDRGNGSWG